MPSTQKRPSVGVSPDLFDKMVRTQVDQEIEPQVTDLDPVDRNPADLDSGDLEEVRADQAARGGLGVESSVHPIATPTDGPVEQHGKLSPEARRCLVRLLQQGAILGSQNPVLFQTLQRHEQLIRDHLADMYLSLLVDPRAEVALMKQLTPDDVAQDDESGDLATLIKRRPLTLYDSTVLLVLRKHYQQRENVGETRVVVEREQIAAQLAPFLPMDNNSSLGKKKLNGCLDKLESHKIIVKQRGDADRIEITPVIRYVVGAEFLSRLEQEYRTLAEDESPSASRRDDQ